MQEQIYYYQICDYYQGGQDKLLLSSKEQADDDCFGMGVSDDDLIDLLDKHHIREEEENVFDIPEEIDEQKLLSILEGTKYVLIPHDLNG